MLASCLISDDDLRSLADEDDLAESRSFTCDLRDVRDELEVDVGSGYFSRSFELLEDDDTCGGGERDREKRAEEWRFNLGKALSSAKKLMSNLLKCMFREENYNLPLRVTTNWVFCMLS